MGRVVVSWLVWCAFLFGLWLAFVGVWNDSYERIAGLCAAALGATAAVIASAQIRLRLRVEPSWVLRLRRALVRVPYEFGLVLVVLAGEALGRPRRGAFRTVRLPARGDDAVAAGRRVLVSVGGSLAPGTLVVDADPRAGELLIHELVPQRGGEPPL